VDDGTLEAPGADIPEGTRWMPVSVVLAVFTGLLLLVDLGVRLFGRLVGPVPAVFELINVGVEGNIATWWNTTLLLGVAGMALAAFALSSAGSRVSPLSWLMIVLVAGYMSLDEASGLHERIGPPIGRWAIERGIALPTYAWLVAGAVVAALGILIMLRWSRRLPTDLRNGLVGAVAIYFTGAVLVEAVNGWTRRRRHDLLNMVGTTLEEGLEMSACLVAMAALAGAFASSGPAARRMVGLRPDLQPKA
jgi:hypothetical protein